MSFRLRAVIVAESVRKGPGGAKTAHAAVGFRPEQLRRTLDEALTPAGAGPLEDGGDGTFRLPADQKRLRAEGAILTVRRRTG